MSPRPPGGTGNARGNTPSGGKGRGSDPSRRPDQRGGSRRGASSGGERREVAGRAGTSAGRPGGDGRRATTVQRASAGPGERGSPATAGEQIEGRQAVRELLRAGRRPVHRLLLAQTIDDSVSTELREWADRRGVPVRTVGRPELDRLAGTEAPQGVIALAAPLPDVELAELCRPAPDGRRPFLVVLDGVTDPHNVGAVARSALCAGATGMVIGRHRAAGLTPAAVKAAAGAVEYLPIATVAGVPAALSQLSEAGLWTVGLDASGPTELWDLQVATEAVAVVLGAEGRGLSRLTMQRCDVVAQIPNAGPLDSLNVSAAAALACYEVARRRSSDI